MKKSRFALFAAIMMLLVGLTAGSIFTNKASGEIMRVEPSAIEQPVAQPTPVQKSTTVKKQTRKAPREKVLHADRDDRERESPGERAAERRRSGKVSNHRTRKPNDDDQDRADGLPKESKLVKSGRSFDGDVRDLPYVKPVKQEMPEREGPPLNPRFAGPPPSDTAGDNTNQTPFSSITSTAAPAPPPIMNFAGLDFATWGAGHPPDTNGDVGPTYFIQTVNTSIGIFRKSDGVRVAAFTFNSFMSQGAFGNLCDTNNFGDPVVLYDSFEDRWIITDFAFQLDGSGNVVNPPGNFECFAASKTGDPVAGGWNYYSVNTAGGLGDYPKLGIWPDGLYMTMNMFGFPSGAPYQNPRAYALNKAQMYAGSPTVQIVSFDLPQADFTVLPSNARLQTGTPPAGTPNYYLSTEEFTNALTVYKFHVDWNRISLSTFTGPDVPTAATTWPNASVPNALSSGGNSLDVLEIRAMVQNQYTNIGGAESLWASHTVRRFDASGLAAPRWYQVNVTGGIVNPVIPQATTWDPDGANVISRFMPSIAVDRIGDMALGYSTSSSTTKPAIKYAGRLFSDPVNTFSQTEQLLIQGTGTQTGNCGASACTRWGDYSAMTLDTDGCTFWYTNEYYAVDGLNDLTRIGSFVLPGCTPLGTGGTVSGTVTATVGGAPISGATVQLGARSTTTNGAGVYSFASIPAGTYPTITANSLGYVSSTISTVVVTDGGTTTDNFSLAAAAVNACLPDTTQADLQTGVATNTDLATSPGDVILLNAASIDQQNTTVTNSGFGIDSASWAGQTFTPAVTGQMVRADVDLFCSGCTGTTPNLTISVRATSGGVPTGADLASATLAGFNSGSGGFFTVTFGSPATLTAGTQYAIVMRATANPSAGTYAYVCSCSPPSNSNPYAGGSRVTSANSGSTWTADVTAGGRDLGFKVYLQSGFATSGNLVSGTKDANPAPGFTPNWTTISWTASVPANTSVKFQAAGSNNINGPFNFVGPDTTAGTFFTTVGASLAQFNGMRYLKYKAFLATTNIAVTPTVNDVTICFTNAPPIGAATHFTVNAPASATAGTAFSFTVTALDASNAVATGYTGTVHFTSTDGAALLPANSTLTNGTGTFSATLKTAGNQTITGTDTVTGLITGTSNAINVSAAAATHFTVSAPGSATAGTAFNFTVTALDQFNNTATSYGGTVHFTSTDGAAVLPANSTLTSGTGTFSATLKTAGNQTLTGTDTVTGSITGTSNAINVSAAAATHFTVSAPGSATAGTAFNFTVTALDQFNNTATSYGGTVHFTSSDGAAVLPANSTLTSGTGTFSATLKTAGNQTITGTDTVTGSITGTSNTINVAAAAATHFAVSAPASATAGTAFNFTVTALDQFNNTATGYGGTVHFTSTDGAAVLPANSTLTSGTGTFSATLKTAGNRTITGSDTVTGSITGTSNAINVSAAAATHFTVSAPAGAVPGVAFSFTVTALDQFNNTATSYGGTVHFTSSDGAAALPANSTLTTGVGTFSATLNTAGPQTITATDTVTSSITGTSNVINVSATAATHFTVSAPVSATAGTAFSFTVTALDASNAVATGYTGTVHFTATDGAAVLPANSTLTNGTGTFTATLKTSGNQTITATDTVTAAITGTSNAINVAAAVATHFTVSAPASATAGTAFSFTVTALDQFNNTATGYTGTVHFTSTDGAAVLPANSTLTNGTGTFSATLKTAGNQTITVTDTVTGSITGTSNAINVSAAAATHFGVSAPASATPGVALNFTVTALDQFNNTATSYGGTVHFTSTDGAAVLPANSTLTSGTGTFSATLNTGGPQTITATDTVTSSITGTSNTIAVASANVGITKTDGVTNVAAGGPVTYTIVASNAGPSVATGVTVADTFPASLTCSTTSVNAGGATGNTVGPTAGNINNSGITLPVGSSITYTSTCTLSVAASGSLSNTATITSGVFDSTPANNSATDTDTIIFTPDLAITKTDNSSSYTPGAPISYTIVVSNNGPSNATGATVTDAVPAAITGVTFNCVASGTASCGTSGSAGSTLSFTNVSVPVGAGNFVTYTASGTVAPATTGNLSNTATVAAGAGQTDTTPGNNTATDIDVQNSTDLSITKTDGVLATPAGSTVIYTIVATNPGPLAAPGSTVTDLLPPAVTGATWICAGTGGAICGVSGGVGSINQTVDLPASSSVTYTVSATINPNATGTLTNSATVAPPAGSVDLNPTNNTATDTDTLTAPLVFIIDDVKKNEGNTGTTAFVFTVTRLLQVANPASVQYTTIDGSATVAGGDYQPVSGTLSFASGEATKTITVLVNGDAVTEPDEFFTVHLFSPGSGTAIRDADGQGLIFNDDGGGQVPTPTPTPTPGSGFEGDINRTAPGVPGTGDGDVTVGDQIQFLRFLTGLDCPSVGTANPALNEQQRLDAGDRSTLGDGLLGGTDGTAIDAYARHDAATDFNPNVAGWQPTPAGGPKVITNLGCTANAAPERSARTASPESKATSAARVVRVVSRPGAGGSDITVEIEMATQGNEAGTQYSLHFDPAVLSVSDISGVDANPDITRGTDAPAGTTLNVNAADAANGNIGIVENFSGASASVRAIPAGATRIAKVKFHVLDGAAAGTSRIDLDNSVVSGITSDTYGMTLPAKYEGGSVSIASAAVGVSVSGRVTSPDGRGIRNAAVRITGQDGVTHSVSTSSFGYYMFDNVLLGENCVISVSVKGYRFATRRVDITGSLADLDFVGSE